MLRLQRLLRRALRDIRGQTAMEYALIAAGIGMALFAVIFAVGADISTFIASAGSTFKAFTPK